ncbi:hypothetical protein FQZ97_1128490 [compost metagenome]
MLANATTFAPPRLAMVVMATSAEIIIAKAVMANDSNGESANNEIVEPASFKNMRNKNVEKNRVSELASI